MTYFIQSGYPFEFAGLCYFGFYLLMTRGRDKDRFSARSKILTLIASIALVASVPFHYGAQPLGIAAMLVLVCISIGSTVVDRRKPPSR